MDPMLTSPFPTSDPCSSTAFKSTASDSHSESQSDYTSEESSKRRGRKTGRAPGRPTERPTETMKKKAEEMDKYWLRSFRAYMREKYALLRGKLTTNQQNFWDNYLSAEGEPGKNTRFHSYSRKYKEFLFAHNSFRLHFSMWFSQFGEANLSKKYPVNSEMWLLFYRHAIEQYTTTSPFGRDQSPLRIKDDGSWIDREELELESDFEVDQFLAFP